MSKNLVKMGYPVYVPWKNLLWVISKGSKIRCKTTGKLYLVSSISKPLIPGSKPYLTCTLLN